MSHQMCLHFCCFVWLWFHYQTINVVPLSLSSNNPSWYHICTATFHSPGLDSLTHWGRVMHICVSKLTIIGSDNGLSPPNHYLNEWWNIVIGPLGTNFSEILSEINTFSFKKMHLKTSSVKWRPFCLGFNVLRSVLVDSSDIFILILQGCFTSTGALARLPKCQWSNTERYV